MFSVPPVTAGGPEVAEAPVVGLMVPLHAVTANPTVQRAATAVSRLVLRDIAFSFRWSLLLREVGLWPDPLPLAERHHGMRNSPEAFRVRNYDIVLPTP